MRKKMVAILLTAVMTATLAACGGSSSGGSSSGGASSSDAAASAESAGGETNWPEKTVRFICPWSAGGDTDFNIRTLAKYLEKELDCTIAVENVTGGGGSVASTQVKDTAADGYTFLAFDTAIALNKSSGVTDFGYEAFDPVALYGKSTGEFIVVRSDFPVDTLDELIKYSQEHPGEVKFAANTGATSYFVATKLTEAGAEFNIVNSGSSSERVAALLGEHIDVSINAMGVISQYLADGGTGDLKIICNTASERPEAYKDIPLASEQGVESLGYEIVYNLLAPKGTDAAVIDRLAAAIENVVTGNADYAEEIGTAYGQTPFVLTGSEMMTYLKDEDDMFMEYADIFQQAAE